MTTAKLKISKVRTDGGTQARAAHDKEAIEEYAAQMADGAEFPAIEVVHEKKGNHYWLVDGFHRVFAAKQAGIKELAALIREGTQADARWLALAANKLHGLRRTNDDKAKAVQAALRERPEMTNAAIAEHVGVDGKTVARYRVELEARQEIPAVVERKGADGKTYDTGAQTTAPARAEKKKAERIAEEPAHRPAPRVTRSEAQDVPDDDLPVVEEERVDSQEDDAIEPPAPAEPLPPILEPADANARVIPVHARWAWEEWSKIVAGPLRTAGQLRRELESLAAATPGHGANHALLRDLARDALNVQDALEQAEPMVCAWCPESPEERCGVCKDAGWLHKHVFDAAEGAS
jgi:ParB-like chromosome segregation protein Spo0J